MKKTSVKERFLYWFDTRMSKGPVSLVKFLALITFLLVLLISFIITIAGVQEEDSFLQTFWASLSTAINAWMPEADAGSAAYVILMAISALIGLLVTSVLIGIISSSIEEKLFQLRKGNSAILEQNHIVILGFTPGEYALLEQLVLSADGKPGTIVIADRMEKDEAEELISANINIPKNIRIIFRDADICDPQSLACCSVSSCRSVAINTNEDSRTLKAILAVSSLLKENQKIKIIASVKKDRFLFSLPSKENSLLLVNTNDIIARIIAHSCSQPGLSDAFYEMFSYRGSELYLLSLPNAAGKSFCELSYSIDRGAPVGIRHNGHLQLNPSPETVLQSEDQLLILTETQTSPILTSPVSCEYNPIESLLQAEAETILILGANEVLDTILQELPENCRKVVLASYHPEENLRQLESEYSHLEFSYFSGDYNQYDILTELVKSANRVILLSDHTLEREDADAENILLLLKLRKIKLENNLSFSLTAEMQCEHNRKLVTTRDLTDYVVSSDISSMVLSQLTKFPELYDVFLDLLSNEGDELFLITAQNCPDILGNHSTAQLRKLAMDHHCVLLGYILCENNVRTVCLNPGLSQTIPLHENDALIVIGDDSVLLSSYSVKKGDIMS